MKIIKEQKGQALVEAAITLPLILLLLFAMLTFGIYIYDMSVMLYASNKALDDGIGKLSGASIDETVKTHMEDTSKNATGLLILTEPVEVDISNETNPDVDREYILKVKLSCKFKFILPLLVGIFKDHEVIKVESSYVYKQ